MIHKIFPHANTKKKQFGSLDHFLNRLTSSAQMVFELTAFNRAVLKAKASAYRGID